MCSLSLHEGDGIFRSASMHNAPAAVVELRRKQPLMRPSGLARLATTKESFQLLDANTNSQSTRNGEPQDLASSIATSELLPHAISRHARRQGISGEYDPREALS